MRSFKALVVVLLTGIAACGTADVFNGAGSTESSTTTGGSTTGTATGTIGGTTGTTTGGTTGQTGGDPNDQIPQNAFFVTSGNTLTLVMSSRPDFCSVLSQNEVPGTSTEITLVARASSSSGQFTVTSATEDQFDSRCRDDNSVSVKPATLMIESLSSSSASGVVSVTLADGANPNATFNATVCQAISNSGGVLQQLFGQCNSSDENAGTTTTTTTGGTTATTGATTATTGATTATTGDTTGATTATTGGTATAGTTAATTATTGAATATTGGTASAGTTGAATTATTGAATAGGTGDATATTAGTTAGGATTATTGGATTATTGGDA